MRVVESKRGCGQSWQEICVCGKAKRRECEQCRVLGNYCAAGINCKARIVVVERCKLLAMILSRYSFSRHDD